jgi:hypothetical protein
MLINQQKLKREQHLYYIKWLEVVSHGTSSASAPLRRNIARLKSRIVREKSE